MVWISSMKRITSGLFSSSFITAFMRSSNWPRYLVPATRLAMSSATMRLLKQHAAHFALDDAQGQAFGDGALPTPGSPISTGLFFLRRLKDLAHAFDLLFAPHDGVQLAVLGHW
jgi:hypothetical protein